MENTSLEQATVIARAWLDEEFKKLLESDPTAAFAQLGFEYDGPETFDVLARPEGLGINPLPRGDSTPPATCTLMISVDFFDDPIHSSSGDVFGEFKISDKSGEHEWSHHIYQNTIVFSSKSNNTEINLKQKTVQK